MSKYAPEEVERYLAESPERYRQPLRRIMDMLHTELGINPIISYQIIGFRIVGSYGIYISAWKDHMSFHGGHFLEPLADQHPEWFKRKGATLWFQDEPELPIEAIRAVISARFASIPPEKLPTK